MNYLEEKRGEKGANKDDSKYHFFHSRHLEVEESSETVYSNPSAPWRNPLCRSLSRNQLVLEPFLKQGTKCFTWSRIKSFPLIIESTKLSSAFWQRPAVLIPFSEATNTRQISSFIGRPLRMVACRPSLRPGFPPHFPLCPAYQTLSEVFSVG